MVRIVRLTNELQRSYTTDLLNYIPNCYGKLPSMSVHLKINFLPSLILEFKLAQIKLSIFVKVDKTYFKYKCGCQVKTGRWYESPSKARPVVIIFKINCHKFNDDAKLLERKHSNLHVQIRKLYEHASLLTKISLWYSMYEQYSRLALQLLQYTTDNAAIRWGALYILLRLTYEGNTFWQLIQLWSWKSVMMARYKLAKMEIFRFQFSSVKFFLF